MFYKHEQYINHLCLCHIYLINSCILFHLFISKFSNQSLEHIQIWSLSTNKFLSLFCLEIIQNWLELLIHVLIINVPYARIILDLDLVAFSCISNLYGGLDAWPIHTEIRELRCYFWRTECRRLGISLQNFNIKSGVSNIDFDISIWGRVSMDIHLKSANGRQSTWPLGAYFKVIARAITALMLWLCNEMPSTGIFRTIKIAT